MCKKELTKIPKKQIKIRKEELIIVGRKMSYLQWPTNLDNDEATNESCNDTSQILSNDTIIEIDLDVLVTSLFNNDTEIRQLICES